MLVFLINLFKGRLTPAALERKRHSILSSFYTMAQQLAALHDEQITTIANLEVKLREIENEKREVEQMTKSTEQTLVQLQNIIGKS